MEVEIAVKDVTAETLNFDEVVKDGLSPLYGFFQFGRYPRTFSNVSVLKDCFFSELYITQYVDKWGSNPPPPHPGMFEEFFPAIISRLTGDRNTLTLYVESIDLGYFDELEVIKTLLVPRNLRYVLLPNPMVPGDRRTQLDFGHLIFEWPLDSLDYVVKHWFMSPIVSIEGYISRQTPLPRIAALYFQDDTEERIRRALRTAEIGFRLWTDNNGLFLGSEKFDSTALKERLHASDLLSLLQEASRRHVKTGT